MLGHTPDVRDGVSWAVRLGIVLALVTSWPAFQALVYRVAVDAPVQVAAVLLPASGLAGESLDARVQQSYDILRLGNTNGQPVAAGQAGQPAAAAKPVLGAPLPKTASALVIATAGIAGALRIAIGFLLAVAPLAIMSLLFSGTNGLFIGWVRALSGLALGLVGATIATAIHLVAVEGEIAHLQAVNLAEAGVDVDPQALTTVVLFFALVTLITTLAGIRMGSALRLARPHAPLLAPPLQRYEPEAQANVRTVMVPGQPVAGPVGAAGASAGHARAKAIADNLSVAVNREQQPAAAAAAGSRQGQRAAPAVIAEAVDQRSEYRPVERIGVAGRRSIGRRTLSAARRDKVA
jgi:type IV secretion system protein VirB6